jgi:SAM-dependent methyltransferase
MDNKKSGTYAIAVDLAKDITKNLAMKSAFIRRWRLSRPRTGFSYNGTDTELENYGFFGLNLLLEHVGDVSGKDICEIGPGDNLASGFAMLAAGAASYTVIDRFPGNYTSDGAQSWYKGIEENWSRFYPEIPFGNGNLKAENFPEAYPQQVELIDQAIEDFEPTRRYDIVCSFQVAEHVSDINTFAANHSKLLKPGGVALHRVDFTAHDVWTGYRNPLTFLEFPDWLWNLTGTNRGAPNRRRHHEFCQAFEQAGLIYEAAYIHSFTESQVDISRLNRKFKEMPRESVLVGTAIYKLQLAPQETPASAVI